MAGEGFWLVPLVAIFGLLLGIVLNHFLPLLANNNLGGGRGRLRGHLPRGSFGWPLLGETLAFLNPHPSNSLGHFLRDHCSRYGKVFKSHLFFSPTVVSCDEELNYFVLQNEGKLFQCSYPKAIHGILGDLSLLVAVGDTHKRLRVVALNLVSLSKSKPELLNDIETAAIRVITSWKGKQRVLFCEEARKFTFNVIVKQVLGLTPAQPETTEILEDFLPFMKGLISLPLYIPGTPYAKAVQARRRIISTVQAMIKKRKMEKDINEVHGVSSNNKERDFLEILLDIEILSEDEKVSFVLDSLLGGYETTSCLLALVVHFIGQSPIALEQLKLEHQVVKSNKASEKHLTWNDYRRMKFTHMVINEALRFGNIVKFVHRKALKDVRYKDYLIPRGWKVLSVFTAVHLDPSLHESPFQFNPWRWEKENQTNKRFTAFGGGNRCCPGSELARVEVAFFLHHLVHTFSWRTEGEDQPIAYPFVEFRNGLLLHLDPVISI